MSTYNKKSKRLKIEDPLIAATYEGSLDIVQNIINKVGFSFKQTWLEGYAVLCSAIEHDQTEIALWLILKNCKINRASNDDTSDTPLHLAIYKDNIVIVKNLIERGAHTNVKNNEGRTPLHIACEVKNIEICQLLLRNNATADVADSNFTTPIHIAVENESLEMLQILLNHKVDINAYTNEINFKGFTPLHIAIMKQNEKICKTLLENGADVNAIIRNYNCEDYDCYTPLHLAVKIENYCIIKLLIQNYDVDVNTAIGQNGITPLHIAIQNKNKRIVIFLSEYNANFRMKTNDGKSVLHLAVESDWLELVEVLIVKGVPVNDQTVNGETALFIAVEMGNDDMVKLLLAHDADVNIQNCKNQSPLHIAVEYNAEIVETLLDKGANIDDVTCDNETPLSIAVKCGDIEIIRSLLNYQPNIFNSINKFAFISAIRNSDDSYLDIVNLLIEYGFRIKPEYIKYTNILHNSVAKGYIKIVEHLLQHGVNINDNFGDNENNALLLHTAILQKDIKMAKLLVRYKCNLNAVDDEGHTVVDYAIQYRYLDILIWLLHVGAKVSNSAYSFLTAAKNSDIPLFRILQKFGRNINVSDEFGTTALHFAVWNKDFEFIQYLLLKKVHVNTTEISTNKIALENVENDEIDTYAKELKRRMFTSPMHIAVSKKSKEICIALLEHYANVNAKDGYGRTPLHLASAIKSNEQKHMIEVLLSYGADINALDDFKRLPIYYIYNQTCVCSIAFQNQYEFYSECECDLYEDYNIDDVIIIFVKHIVLLNCMNKYIHEDNLKIVSINSDFSEQLQISCLSEISKMKREKVCNFVTFYDILTKKSNALAFYARNKDIIHAFQNSNYENKFPLYCRMLEKQIKVGLIREKLLKTAVSIFSPGLDFKLPETVLEKIFDYLYLNDLCNISFISKKKTRDQAYYMIPLMEYTLH